MSSQVRCAPWSDSTVQVLSWLADRCGLVGLEGLRQDDVAQALVVRLSSCTDAGVVPCTSTAVSVCVDLVEQCAQLLSQIAAERCAHSCEGLVDGIAGADAAGAMGCALWRERAVALLQAAVRGGSAGATLSGAVLKAVAPASRRALLVGLGVAYPSPLSLVPAGDGAVRLSSEAGVAVVDVLHALVDAVLDVALEALGAGGAACGWLLDDDACGVCGGGGFCASGVFRHTERSADREHAFVHVCSWMCGDLSAAAPPRAAWSDCAVCQEPGQLWVARPSWGLFGCQRHRARLVAAVSLPGQQAVVHALVRPALALVR